MPNPPLADLLQQLVATDPRSRLNLGAQILGAGVAR